jgi:hypothetical protein
MSSPTRTEGDRQSLAEAALRLCGKTDEEARRTGAVDKADEQVESLFAAQYQTVNSPIHKAVWDKRVPLELFVAPPLPASAPCDVLEISPACTEQSGRAALKAMDAGGTATILAGGG